MRLYLIVTNLVTLSIALYLLKKNYDQKYSYKTFRRLIEGTNIGYYRYRVKDGVILSANRGFVTILEVGKGVDEVIGRSLSELLIYVDGAASIREQLKLRGDLKNYEYYFKTLGGKDKVVLHNSYMTKDPYTGEEVIEVLIEDITEERLSYEKMRESQQRYEKLFKNSGDSVITCKLDDFTVEEVNPVTALVLGYEEEDLIGTPFVSLFHPSGRKDLEAARKDLFFQGVARVETIIICKDGTYKEVILTLSSVEIKDVKIVMVVIKDVSALADRLEEEDRRKRELEEFWDTSIKREERIEELSLELERVNQKLNALEKKNEQ